MFFTKYSVCLKHITLIAGKEFADKVMQHISNVKDLEYDSAYKKFSHDIHELLEKYYKNDIKLFLEKIRNDEGERKKLDTDLKNLIRYLDHQYHIVSSLFGHANSVDVQLSTFSQRVHIPYRDSELLKNSRATIFLLAQIRTGIDACVSFEEAMRALERKRQSGVKQSDLLIGFKVEKLLDSLIYLEFDVIFFRDTISHLIKGIKDQVKDYETIEKELILMETEMEKA